MPQSSGHSSCWRWGALLLWPLLLSPMTPLLPEPPKAAELAAPGCSQNQRGLFSFSPPICQSSTAPSKARG